MKVFGYFQTIVCFSFLGLSTPSFAYIPFKLPAMQPGMQGCPLKECSCRCDDPYEPRARAPFGPHQFECLDTCFLRSVTPLSLKDNYLYLANVGHNGSFYKARVNIDAIEQVIYQVETFGIWPSNHGQLRFKFKKDHPVILSPQMTSEDPKVRFELHDFVYSVGGISPPGAIYGVDQASKGAFTNIYQFVSLIENAHLTLEYLKHHISQFELNLSVSEKRKLLLGLINRSKEIGYNQLYDFGKTTCVMELFQVLDVAFEGQNKSRNEKTKEEWLSMINRNVPSNIVYYFQGVGILGKKLPDLNTELGWPNLF